MEIDVPEDSSILHVGLDTEGNPCLWEMHTPGALCTPRKVRIINTGEPFMCSVEDKHVGTIVWERFNLVLHVFVNLSSQRKTSKLEPWGT